MLLTLNEYKTFENINSTSNDTRLKAILISVDRFVKNYCARELEPGTYVESPEIEDQTLFLHEFPITSIASIDYIDYEDATQTLETTDYRLWPDEGILEIHDDAHQTALYDAKYTSRYLTVTYSGGYAEIPEDLKIAVSGLVTYYFKDESSPVKSQNVRTIDYSVLSAINLPPHIRRVLDLYRRIE